MRRIPEALVIAVLFIGRAFAAGSDELPLAVRNTLEVRGLPAETLSIYVEDLMTGEPVLRWHDTAPRNPASTIKLLTTLVALDLLGPAYTWITNVYALGTIEGDTLEGDLLIQGRGDPFLVTERVWQMLRRVRQAGIREITGDLLIDDSYFDVAAEDPAAFDRQPLRAYNVTPNALLMNFKVVRYWFEPDHGANAVRLWLDPPLANIAVVNELMLAAGRCRGYQRGITISTNAALDKVTFSGKFPSGCRRYAMDRTALSHNDFALGLFGVLWSEMGGSFDGRMRNAVTPDNVEPLVSFESVPLADVISRVNKHSNNVMARQLLYTLAAEKLGAPGTEARGRKVVSDWLAGNGLDFAEFAIENGAGRSRDVRIRARDLGAMLAFAWRQTYMPEYLSSLSLAGSDGTLRRRLDDEALVGRAHLKTGSLDHVTAIAGYLQSRSDRRFAVVVLQNHRDVHRGPGEEVQEALLRWLNRQ